MLLRSKRRSLHSQLQLTGPKGDRCTLGGVEGTTVLENQPHRGTNVQHKVGDRLEKRTNKNDKTRFPSSKTKSHRPKTTQQQDVPMETAQKM